MLKKYNLTLRLPLLQETTVKSSNILNMKIVMAMNLQLLKQLVFQLPKNLKSLHPKFKFLEMKLF